MIKKTSKYGLPEDVVFCKKCVISNQRPSSSVEFKTSDPFNKKGINFQDDGICSACKFNEEKNQNIDWKKREDELLKLLERHRKNDGSYDVIIPGSGGKDSAYTAHVLKYKYNMNPLTITWAPHLYTDIGWENFSNWMHVGGLDNLLYTPNGKLHRKLTNLAFKNLLHPFQPFIIGQRLIGPSIASKFGVNLIMYGENQAEYGNNVDENKSPNMKSDFFSLKQKESIYLSGMSIKDIIKNTEFNINDFVPYFPIDTGLFNNLKIDYQYLGYYLKWDPQECYYYATENTGFKANIERTQGSYSKYSSIDDKIDPFHYYTTLIKFGLGRASYDAAQEIRNEKITREEGIALVKKYDQEFPDRFFNEFLEYIDMDEGEFWKTIDDFRPLHLWKKENKTWKLKHTVFK
jgi:N-acetyl sugar amidotransferase